MLPTSSLRSTSSRRASQAPSVPTSKYLTFRLGEEEYGIDILCVQEIRSYDPPTRMAYAPDPRRPPKVLHLWPPKLLHPAWGDLMH